MEYGGPEVMRFEDHDVAAPGAGFAETPAFLRSFAGEEPADDETSPPDPKPAPDGLAYFDHVSLAVKDIATAYNFFTRYFPGTKISHEIHTSNSEGNFDLGHLEVAGFKIEFIQSPAHKPDNDFVGKFIARYGEGMHHVSIDLKDFDETREKLKRDGVRVVDEKRNWRGERQYFISPQSAFGVLIQIWDGLS